MSLIGYDSRINYYIFDLDFSEYMMEHGIREHNEIWGFLEDYIKEECE
jgi:hypothetical protein